MFHNVSDCTHLKKHPQVLNRTKLDGFKHKSVRKWIFTLLLVKDIIATVFCNVTTHTSCLPLLMTFPQTLVHEIFYLERTLKKPVEI